MTPVAPWQTWWADLDPVRGHEQSGNRPVLVVSSLFHLRLTRGALVAVLPLTSKERPHLLHRVRIDTGRNSPSYVITEQIRTISVARLLNGKPFYDLTAEQIASVRDVLRRMIDA